MPGHCENDASLGKMMRAWETPFEHHRTIAPEHALAVPPPSGVHLAMPGDGEAKPE
jgi:hypothetical protein